MAKKELASKLNDKRSPARLNGRSEWELCTTELVMFEFAMEYHGNRFRTRDHSTVSLDLLKETLFNSAQVQLPDNTERSPCTTETSKTSSMMATGAKGDDDMWRGQANVEYIVMRGRKDPRLEGA